MAFAAEITPAERLLTIIRSMDNKTIREGFPTVETRQAFPCYDEVRPDQAAYNPLNNWVLSWKTNYFAATHNIYELRGDKYVCRECGDKFPTRLSILTHSKIHCKPFCVLCGEYMTTQSAMEFHMQREHKHYTYYKNVFSTEPGEDASRTARETCGNNKLKRALFSNKNRIKKATTAPVKEPERITKVVTSRFGRCITVKIPEF